MSLMAYLGRCSGLSEVKQASKQASKVISGEVLGEG